MHYLVFSNPHGSKLIDFGDEVLRLRSMMLEMQQVEQPRGRYAILNETMVRGTYLCDDFGIPVKDDDWLIRLDDL